MATELTFPALFHDADDASNKAQRYYLGLILVEYSLLFVAALLSMFSHPSLPFIYGYAMVFLIAFAVMLIRAFYKLEQEWYRSRALAESLKTITWRYAMRAKPFDDAKSVDARKDFVHCLQAILESNKHLGSTVSGSKSDGKQITSEMDGIRNLPLAERKSTYRLSRIIDQRKWYKQNARFNRSQLALCLVACGIVYALAAATVLGKLTHPDTSMPTEPLIVIASFLVGWIQIRKFSELSSAYTLTAHEIGIVEERIENVSTEDAFSAFVNEAELAFSREHTQWVARQHQS